ncbi:MAG TPA: ThiF family adenylyltransferase [Bryobacteraceae bacterium]|nr:ThiF family adenylyltransferase [Bryobacteraceae bacterium]
MLERDRDRYSRQIRFSAIGEAGQQRIIDARIALVGCGALGSFQAAALARAGAGLLRIIDRDYVEASNLQRQWLFEESDAAAALPKAIAARARLARINSGVRVEAEVADLTAANAGELLSGVDLILDGTDNFETRYLINDYSARENVPWIYGAAVGSYGLAMAVIPGRTACLACVYPDPPSGAQPTCETAGVLGPATSLVASLQVAAALKLIVTGDAPRLLTTVDVWSGELRQISNPARDPKCRACARHEFTYLNNSRRTPVSMCGRDAVQIHEHARPVDLSELAERLARIGPVRENGFALRFETPPWVLTVFPDGRVIVKGTTDPGVARSVYARYIGG